MAEKLVVLNNKHYSEELQQVIDLLAECYNNGELLSLTVVGVIRTNSGEQNLLTFNDYHPDNSIQALKMQYTQALTMEYQQDLLDQLGGLGE